MSSSYEYKSWSYIDFDHPTTFETLAMERAKKKEIMEDLDAFRENRDFYRRTGKPWKRGYLLHGPPGTGKSTMVAAMANYLDYDIYDIELTSVHSNSDLRKLFIGTKSKSIIVIEARARTKRQPRRRTTKTARRRRATSRRRRQRRPTRAAR